MPQLMPNGTPVRPTVHVLNNEIRGLMYSARLIGADEAASYFSDAADWTNYDENPEPSEIVYWLEAGHDALDGYEFAGLIQAAATNLIVRARQFAEVI